jgi:hypothetical protein
LRNSAFKRATSSAAVFMGFDMREPAFDSSGACRSKGNL